MTEKKRQEYIDILQECLDDKWLNPVYPEIMYTAINCAACRVSWNEHGCEECPIFQVTEMEGCRETPVYRDIKYKNEKTSLSEDEWNEMVKDECSFLKAIITHLQAGHGFGTFKDLTDYNWQKDLEE